MANMNHTQPMILIQNNGHVVALNKVLYISTPKQVARLMLILRLSILMITVYAQSDWVKMPLIKNTMYLLHLMALVVKMDLSHVVDKALMTVKKCVSPKI